MQYREDIVAACKDAANAHPNDIETAVQKAFEKIRRAKNYAEFVDQLAFEAVRNCVYDCRHTANVQMRRQNGNYGGPAKVESSKSESVRQVSLSLYAYFIAGRTLGTILGEELPAIADSEDKRAEGHRFNANLCRALAPLVSEGKTVQQCVKQRKLKQIWDSVT